MSCPTLCHLAPAHASCSIEERGPALEGAARPHRVPAGAAPARATNR